MTCFFNMLNNVRCFSRILYPLTLYCGLLDAYYLVEWEEICGKLLSSMRKLSLSRPFRSLIQNVQRFIYDLYMRRLYMP